MRNVSVALRTRARVKVESSVKGLTRDSRWGTYIHIHHVLRCPALRQLVPAIENEIEAIAEEVRKC